MVAVGTVARLDQLIVALASRLARRIAAGVRSDGRRAWLANTAGYGEASPAERKDTSHRVPRPREPSRLATVANLRQWLMLAG